MGDQFRRFERRMVGDHFPDANSITLKIMEVLHDKLDWPYSMINYEISLLINSSINNY